MAISEESRYHLYQRLEEVLGADEAATLMEHLPPVGWADVATKRDIEALAVATKGDIGSLAVATKRDFDAFSVATKRDFEALAVATKGDIGSLAVATKRDLDDLKRDIGVLASVTATREQMADLRGQLERELRSLTWRFITVLIAAISIVIAGIRL
jgi:hypothetical protein